ncbi:MAG: hypothetical protein IPN92_06865 [Chromatiaceae bacterium]|nr:hypothetical protein [Chromatiaceae bacterium]
MPRLFDRYRFRDAVTPLSEATFNRIFADLDLRLANLEAVQVAWEAALDQVAAQGLERVALAMSGPLATLAADVAVLAAQVTAAQQAGMLLDAPGSVTDENLGPRTLADTSAPASDSGALTVLLGGLANRLKAITGAANWRTAPAATLAALASASLAASNHVASMDNPHQATASQVGALPLAGGTLSGALGLGNNALGGVKTLGYQAEYDNGTSGAAKTITLTNGGRQKLSLSANCALTITTTAAPVGLYVLRIISSGAFTVTWSGLTGGRWLGATSAPAVQSGAGKETLVTVFWGGTAATSTQRMENIGAA